MATLSYVRIPSTAKRQDAKRQRTSLPSNPPNPPASLPTSFAILPQLLLSSSVPSEDAGYNPRRKRTKAVLLSNKDPLSIQTTTINFKRFVDRVGGLFWFQDTAEELMTWKKGWKPTTALLCVYAFICTFPQVLFVLPLVILACIMLSTAHIPRRRLPPPAVSFAPPSTTQDASPPPVEDSVDYQGNLQAIQNLMGLHADTHAAITPILSQLSLSSPVSTTVLTILALLIPSILFLSPFIPTRLIAFFGVALPVLSSNPHLSSLFLQLQHHVASSLRPNYLWTWSPSPTPTLTLPIPRPLAFFFPNRSLPLKPVPLTPRSFFPQHIPKVPVTQISFRFCPRPFITVNVSLPRSHMGASGLINRLKSLATLALSTNSLTDRIWNAELREVELWENERCDSQTAMRFGSVLANAGHDTNANATSTLRIGRKLSESLAFSSSPSTSPTVKKAKKAAKSNTSTPTSPTWTQTRTRNALLDTLAPLPPFALIPPLPASAMGDLVEEGSMEGVGDVETTLEKREREQKEYKENQNQKRPSLSMLSPKRTFSSSSSSHINPVPSSSSSANHINSISPEITQAIQTFKKGFSKSNLGTERAPWTRGRDGFGGINPLGVGLGSGSGSGSGNTSTSMGTNAMRRTMSGAHAHAHGEYEDPRDGKGASGNSGGGYEAGSEPAALGPGMISESTNKHVLTKTNSIIFPFPRLTQNLTRRSRFPQHTTHNTPYIALALTSNLTFSLAPGWKFIETEDWRVDYDAGAGASSVGAFKPDQVSSLLDDEGEDDDDEDDDEDGEGDSEEDGDGDGDDFGNGKSERGRWLDITFKAGVRKRTRPIGPSHGYYQVHQTRQTRQSQEEEEEEEGQWEQERKHQLEISFFIVFGVSVNVDVSFSFGRRGGTGVNDEDEDKGWMCGGDEGGFFSRSFS
ncbi:hypothetical protein D9758_010096 [Tetrapyrgos nigripes]|uniref:TECPR1-like DysF domain-containing protein n=1 Tax=Tetrapyrgos nigripes TaxID=182062 RepID=A0A8H5FSB1_9AGAR|nr:hypothetical protein D9758_010096 [Tetrapyrgos nigripes]